MSRRFASGSAAGPSLGYLQAPRVGPRSWTTRALVAAGAIGGLVGAALGALI